MILLRRAVLLAPLAVATLGGGAFWAMLRRMDAGRFDPHAVPNPLIGEPMPRFDLPGLTSADLVAAKRPVLLNFFASWCLPCLEEAASLMRLRAAGLPIWGIAYKDTLDATARFMARAGNPYRGVAQDRSGRVAIDFGVTGVPESFLIDPGGILRRHWAGPLPVDVAL